MSGHVSDCLARAADAKQRADNTTDAKTKIDLLSQERNWNSLACSFQFAASLEWFIHGCGAAAEGWQPAPTAPYLRQLELAVINSTGIHPLVFPCCRAADGWIDARTGRYVDVAPTHWREWMEIDPSDRQPPAEGRDDVRSSGKGLVIFESGQVRLSVERGDGNSFELVVSIQGEESTAYDLDRDSLATIGRRLLALAAKA